jgi:dTDP-D-glucose 4,6-dehydratase
MEAVDSVKMKKREAAIRQIVKQHQAAKIDGVLVDAFTASGLVKMLDNLNPQNKTRFLSVSIEQMADIMWKVLKKK